MDVQLSLRVRNCSLTLHIYEQREELLQPVFHAAEQSPELETELLVPSEHNWRLIQDLAANKHILEVVNDQGCYRIIETGTEVTRATRERYSFHKNVVSSACGETWTRRCFKREDWDIEVITRTVLTSDPQHFHIHAQLDAYDEGNGYFLATGLKTYRRIWSDGSLF